MTNVTVCTTWQIYTCISPRIECEIKRKITAKKPRQVFIFAHRRKRGKRRNYLRSQMKKSATTTKTIKQKHQVFKTHGCFWPFNFLNSFVALNGAECFVLSLSARWFCASLGVCSTLLLLPLEIIIPNRFNKTYIVSNKCSFLLCIYLCVNYYLKQSHLIHSMLLCEFTHCRSLCNGFFCCMFYTFMACVSFFSLSLFLSLALFRFFIDSPCAFFSAWIMTFVIFARAKLIRSGFAGQCQHSNFQSTKLQNVSNESN